MIQTAQITFKGESSPPKGKTSPTIYVGLVAIALVVAGYVYLRYLHNLTPDRMPAAASASNGSQASAKTGKPDLGDSLMSVLTPSAKAETAQPGTQPGNTEPGTIPVSRQPLQLLAPPAQGSRALTENQKLWQTAQAGFTRVMDMARSNPDIFGFAPEDQMENAKLETPLRVYTIAEADMKGYQSGQPVKPLLQATNEWIFPVMLDNRVRFMVPVRLVGQDYVAEPGSRSLAMVYQKITERWPASEGYHPQLVVNASIADYYFTVPELSEPNLTDTSEMFQYNPVLSPASVILASWQ